MMTDFKTIIANVIAKVTNIDQKEIYGYIEIPKDISNGDYAFPCFKLAKIMKKSPQQIATEIKEKISFEDTISADKVTQGKGKMPMYNDENDSNDKITKIDIAGGYLNFYINNQYMTKEVLEKIENEEQYGKAINQKNKNIVIDYSSPNIAKPFHIGHLKTTVIGGALYNIYKYLGYNVTGVNHLGDYGTQFGKLIEGYKLWGSEYDLSEDPIDKLADIYKRINELCKEDEKVLDNCRENFKLLEQGDEYCTKLWQEFKDLSIKEFQKIYDLLGSKFDSWNGEAFYADKTDEVIQILQKTGNLQESEGAMIVDLSDKGIDTPCIICKTNGSTIYATRDLAAILYRSRTYDFDKALYVTSYEQNLHFKQIFEVAKLLGLDEKYTNGLEHVPYGFVRLSTGRMSTRLGNFVKVEDLLNDAINQAKKIIEEKNPNLENKEEIAKKVGIGAIIFNDLATSRIKDEIFDIDAMLNFQGETGPYIQYTYVRTNSVLEKAKSMPKFEDVDTDLLQDEYSQKIIKLIYNFEEILNQVIEKSEPSILARYLIDLSKAYSNFYNENKIICDDENLQNARVYLTFATGKVLKDGAKLLGIQMPEKM
ncbi:MAG: arginine--tRNA ligase [Clostridia bacterium]|nr:arginine--tRNA ligase [Clostridia bacterium]